MVGPPASRCDRQRPRPADHLPPVIRSARLGLRSICDTRVQTTIRIGSGSSGEALLVGCELTIAWVAPLPALQAIRIILGTCGRGAKSYRGQCRESNNKAHLIPSNGSVR